MMSKINKMGLLTVFTLLATFLAISTTASASTLRERIENVASGLLSSGHSGGRPQREPQVQVACNDVNPCPASSHQICVHGTCRCPHPTEQYHWYSRSRCEIDAGRPCHPSSPIPCYRNSACEADTNSRTGYTCKCQNGLESDGFYCTNGFMGNCSRSWGDETGCNYGAMLGCYDGKCRCEFEPDQRYDLAKNRCTSLRGFPCLTLEIGYYDCASGPECVRRDGSTEYPTLGVCVPKST